MHEAEHAPHRRFLWLAFDDVDSRGVQPAGNGVHHVGIAHLPPDVGDIFGFVIRRVDDEPVVALVHA